MNSTVGAFEAKTHLSELLDRVEKGEEITITRHGTPVAKLLPVDHWDRVAVRGAIDELRRLRKGTKLRGLKIRDLVEEGRR
jgi:prevent-host-death family protein